MTMLEIYSLLFVNILPGRESCLRIALQGNNSIGGWTSIDEGISSVGGWVSVFREINSAWETNFMTCLRLWDLAGRYRCPISERLWLGRLLPILGKLVLMLWLLLLYGEYRCCEVVCIDDFVSRLSLPWYLLDGVTVGFAISCFCPYFLSYEQLSFSFLCKYLWAAIIFKWKCQE